MKRVESQLIENRQKRRRGQRRWTYAEIARHVEQCTGVKLTVRQVQHAAAKEIGSSKALASLGDDLLREICFRRNEGEGLAAIAAGFDVHGASLAAHS